MCYGIDCYLDLVQIFQSILQYLVEPINILVHTIQCWFNLYPNGFFFPSKRYLNRLSHRNHLMSVSKALIKTLRLTPKSKNPSHSESPTSPEPLSAMADDTHLNLNCLVFGDHASHIFSVKIAKSEIVCALREAIKNKKSHAFQHVDADALVLWKVSVLVDQNLTTTLYNRAFDDQLLPLDLLSDVFSDPPAPKRLHIVVRAPTAGGKCE